MRLPVIRVQMLNMDLLYCWYSQACASVSPLQAFLTTAVCMVGTCSNSKSGNKSIGLAKGWKKGRIFLERNPGGLRKIQLGNFEIEKINSKFPNPKIFPCLCQVQYRFILEDVFDLFDHLITKQGKHIQGFQILFQLLFFGGT